MMWRKVMCKFIKSIKPNSTWLPFFLKIYLIKHSSIFLKIKLFQCSKEFGRLTAKSWDREYSSILIIPSGHKFVLYNASNFTATLDLNDLKKLKKAVTVKNILRIHFLEASPIHNFIPKLDLSSLSYLAIKDSTINLNDFKKLLVQSLEAINISSLNFNGNANVDLIRLILKKLPAVTEIYVPWQRQISSFPTWTNVERPKKLKLFHLTEVTIGPEGDDIFINDIKLFETQHMTSDSSIYLISPTSVMVYENYID